MGQESKTGSGLKTTHPKLARDAKTEVAGETADNESGQRSNKTMDDLRAQSRLYEAPIFDQLRALALSEGLWKKSDIDQVKPHDLGAFVLTQIEKRDTYAQNKAQLPDWIGAGYVSATVGNQLARWELRELDEAVDFYEQALEMLGRQRARRQVDREPSNSLVRQPSQVPQAPVITRGEVVSALAEVVTVMAALHVHVDELTEQVANLKNANLAMFGRQAVIDQLTNTSRDFENIDITIELEEQSTQSADHEAHESGSKHTASTSNRSALAKVEGLASLVAGLNVGGAVDIGEMKHEARRMTMHARDRAQVRSKGKIRLKIGKVSGGT